MHHKIIKMSTAIYKTPLPFNEPVLDYLPGSSERIELKKELKYYKSKELDIPMIIGGKEVRTNNPVTIRPPHEIIHSLGKYYMGTEEHVYQAIDAALEAREQWQALTWDQRAAVFLKAAELVSGKYRQKLNATTMLGQSKNVYQAEIDAACEFADFLRFNVYFMTEIYQQQPLSSKGVWNRMEQRPLEGFVYAISPFNFTSLAGNLAAAPALMGNVVVWKPSETQIYSATIIMDIFKEAGLPDGVINMIFVPGPVGGHVMAKHPDFVGVHFTGSNGVFNKIWKAIGDNVHLHNTYPKIVGETGGKDFVMVHKSAVPSQVATALARGAFEYQGQKCSAASRAYIPSNLWPEIKKQLIRDVKSFKMGSPEDFSNFITAVIDEVAFNKLTSYIDAAKKDKDAEIIVGGNYDKTKGYFIEPTIILTDNPSYITIREELFGPVLTIFVYPENDFENTLHLVDKTSPYALTGAIFSKDRYAIDLAAKKAD